MSSHIPSVPAAVVSTRAGDTTLVHHMITQQLYRLDEVGGRIWELIDGGRTIDVIVRTLGSEYALPDGVPPSQLRDDVMTILAELRRHGLVTLSPSDRRNENTEIDQLAHDPFGDARAGAHG